MKKLIFRSRPDETTRAAALKRGDVDVAYFLNGPIAEEVRRTPGLRLMAVRSNTVFFLDFRGQWEAGSPWQDPRVRMAASVAIDRRAMNDAERLGFGGLTGNVVPRALDFALPIDADPYDPPRPSASSPRPASRVGSTRATSRSRRPTRAPARPSRTTWPQQASA